MNLVHITWRSAWEQAQRTGEYRTKSLETEGFIHCSTEETVLKVANAWFTTETGLVLLYIDPARVRAEIKWEGPYGGDYYPHIYGQLNVDAVIREEDFAPGPDGLFHLPS